MLADADEYLWFSEMVGVKDFLHARATKLSYLSFGKVMYSMKQVLAVLAAAAVGPRSGACCSVGTLLVHVSNIVTGVAFAAGSRAPQKQRLGVQTSATARRDVGLGTIPFADEDGCDKLGSGSRFLAVHANTRRSGGGRPGAISSTFPSRV